MTATLRVTGFFVVSCALAAVLTSPARPANPVTVDQGPQWTAARRASFYRQDQGSQLIPLAWIRALRQPGGAPFLQDSLGRYGYLANPASPTPGLPVGFTTNSYGGKPMLGMSCAACHTRQIVVDDTAYRIDGGPAIVDFRSFVADLDTAVNAVLINRADFVAFASSVFGRPPNRAEEARLRKEVEAWYLRYDTLFSIALPPEPWGITRVDAVGLIFDRLTGLDLGEPPSYLIPENIRRADAPVRYPFLWNAPKQDFTQWPGFSPNGSDLLGLARNLGEVYGVFGTFAPRKDSHSILGVDYTGINSANFAGLSKLETNIRHLGPPKWPWAIDQSLANQGKAIFNLPTDQGGCVACHGIRPGITRFPNWKTWATPIQDVGTDSREYQILGWTADSGELTGASIPFLSPTPIKPVDSSLNILSISVFGAILENYLSFPILEQAQPQLLSVPPRFDDLKGDFQTGSTSAAYESRALEGIWAAAPYLHNGSVPTLAELLKPAHDRVYTFAIGPIYDKNNVGLARRQGQFSSTLHTTGCNDVSSGNSHCGHEYGTTLSEPDKRALLEYLKTL